MRNALAHQPTRYSRVSGASIEHRRTHRQQTDVGRQADAPLGRLARTGSRRPRPTVAELSSGDAIPAAPAFLVSSQGLLEAGVGGCGK